MPLMQRAEKPPRARAYTSKSKVPTEVPKICTSSKSEQLRRQKNVNIAERAADIRQWGRSKIKLRSSSETPKKLGKHLSIFRSPASSLDASTEARENTSHIEKEPATTEKKSNSGKSNSGDWRPKLSEKGKEIARTFSWPTLRENVRPKQKDPLHQWMVDHSGGMVRST
ncbi:hypothetical protein F5Y11DRAFT_59223 [Daldinia sp. FL1419]|nr:hypothetical protein F5Y11DRAFT_59223 [Daldinia sp. FL1419]